jgi:hypothetical protein
MGMPDVLNSKSFKAFIKGSLVLIGLFFALSCGVTVLLFHLDKNYTICNIPEVNKNPEISKNTDINNDPKIGNNINIINNFNITNNFNIDVCSLIKFLITPLIILLIFILIMFSIFGCLMKSKDDKSKDDKSKDDKSKDDKSKDNIPITQKEEKNLLANAKEDKQNEINNSMAQEIDRIPRNDIIVKSPQEIQEKTPEHSSELNLREKESNSEQK